MNKRKLGRTNLHVSELGLNATRFGWSNDETTSLALLDTYFACGGGFVQTLGLSPDPAVTPLGNRSEEIVGGWHETRGIARESLVLATRMHLVRPAHGGSITFANRLRDACTRSLRRLRTDHLDLLVCDWDEQLLPVDDLLEAVDLLLRAGQIRYVVAGEFPAWRVVDSLHRSGARNHPRFEAVESEYSLMTRARFEAEALAMCREHRLGFIARSPLAGGYLAQRPLSLRELNHLDHSWQSERFGNNAGDAVLTALSEIADRHAGTPAQIALAWVLRNSQVTSTLVSAASTHELRDLIRSADFVLEDDDARALADVTTVQDYRMELRHA